MDSSIPRKPFLAKGSNVVRCDGCMMSQLFCICDEKQVSKLDPNFPMEIWLLMHKEESYKPSNTGRLIEDVLPSSTKRFYWHRTEPDPEFIKLLQDDRYQPHIIFPGDRGGYEDRVVERAINTENKVPVFIILDGSWRQAGRMFRLSQYLQHLPVLPLTTQRESQYRLRKAPDEFHLCTVEVGIELLSQYHQPKAAEVLQGYFKHFNQQYALSRRNIPAAK